MVAGHIQQWDVKPADQVLEVIERQVAAAQDQVGPDAGQAVTVETLIDLVGDREDAQWLDQARLKRRAVQFSSMATNETGL